LIGLGVTEISSLTCLPQFLELSFATDPSTQFELTIDMSRNGHSALEDGDLGIIVVPEMPFQSNAIMQQIAAIEIAQIGKPSLFPTTKS
jgi:hypothetical protein